MINQRFITSNNASQKSHFPIALKIFQIREHAHTLHFLLANLGTHRAHNRFTLRPSVNIL